MRISVPTITLHISSCHEHYWGEVRICTTGNGVSGYPIGMTKMFRRKCAARAAAYRLLKNLSQATSDALIQYHPR